MRLFILAKTRPWLTAVVTTLLALGAWRWAEGVLIPGNTKEALGRNVPIGNNSDLYPRWLGTRELLLHGRDPYSPEVTREIQAGFYGRPLDPARAADPKAEESFVYPLYVVFLMAPFVTLHFSTAVEIFRWLLLLSMAISVPLWAYALGIRWRLLHLYGGMALAASSYPAILEFRMQNLTAFVALLLALAAATMRRGWLVLAGVLLALATVKPDVTLPLILWFLLWATGSPERRRLLWSFAIAMGTLVAAAEALSAGWILRFLRAVRAYPAYGGDPSILQIFLPPLGAKLAMAALAVGVLIICWRARKTATDSAACHWTVVLVVGATLVTIPKLAAYNYALLVPAFLVICASGFGEQSLARLVAKTAVACQGWQWAAATVLAVASWFVAPERMQSIRYVPLYTLFAVPILVFLAAVFATASLGGTDSNLTLAETPDAPRE